MGRGAWPLLNVIRYSPKRPAQESMETTAYMNVGEMTPTSRKLMSGTTADHCGRYPLELSDENSVDTLMPRGKYSDATTTPKGKSKKGGQCLFPLTENIDHYEGGVCGTPDKQANGKTKKTQQSPMKPLSVARPLPDTRPADMGSEMAAASPRKLVGEVSQLSAGFNTKGGQLIEQNIFTPRTSQRSERGTKFSTESAEAATSSSRLNCSSLQPSVTPVKTASRILKYGAAPGLPTPRAFVPPANNGRNVPQGSSEQSFELEEDQDFWNDHNVQVLIRTRPLSSMEVASQGFSNCLKQESPHTITWAGPPESRFTFDHVAGETVSQEKLFKVAGLPMVENCLAGYNSCMFAYGQTGSGKTHTMLGDIDHLSDKPSENRGMTPRVFEYLFSRIRVEEEQRSHENLRFLTKCSFLEIYNEQITDLLEPSSTNLQMREDTRKGVYVENLTEIEVQSVQDVIQLLLIGSSNRRVAATNMNRESSRSHSVFTCTIQSKWESESMTNIRFGQLNLVDLAGSERQRSSGAEGERLKEAANINKSLSTLGLVIMILVDVANGKQRHVPYRDSKLTFLLQDSLGGNSKTTIIATVSPSSCNALETLSTLKFAQRAKLIRNTAVVNEDASGDVKALRAQIQQMKQELDRLRRQSISRIPLTQDDFNPVRSSFDSWGDANKFFGSPQTSNRKVRQMEAVVAGALRREQAAEATTKRLAAEIEQLNHLVHQREADTQSGKMILRFREDKIRRLETLSKGLLSVDSYLVEEKNMLMEEIQLIQEKVDRNPELTRFAMENIRLLDQLRSVQEFHEGGEREVMLKEIANLRDQLLEVLEGKIAADEGLVPLTSPQKKSLASELAAAGQENELLRIEGDNYRVELEELRSNLSSSLEGYAKMGRQVDELQEVIAQLKLELASKEHSPDFPNPVDLEEAQQQELIANLKLQLAQSLEKSKMQEKIIEELMQKVQPAPESLEKSIMQEIIKEELMQVVQPEPESLEKSIMQETIMKELMLEVQPEPESLEKSIMQEKIMEELMEEVQPEAKNRAHQLGDRICDLGKLMLDEYSRTACSLAYGAPFSM